MTVKNGVYTVTGKVERKGLVHSRRVTYQPGVSVMVADHVEGAKGMRPVVYWHLASDLTATIDGTSVAVLAGDDVVARMTLQRGDCQPTIVKGRGGNAIQGWVSPSYMKRLPAAVVEYHCAAGVQDIQTRIVLGGHVAKTSVETPRSIGP